MPPVEARSVRQVRHQILVAAGVIPVDQAAEGVAAVAVAAVAAAEMVEAVELPVLVPARQVRQSSALHKNMRKQ